MTDPNDPYEGAVHQHTPDCSHWAAADHDDAVGNGADEPWCDPETDTLSRRPL